MAESRESLHEALLRFVREPDPAAFDGLASRVVAYQAAALGPYGRLVAARGGLPEHWRQAPLVPTDHFRELDLCSLPSAVGEQIFMTSGTTTGSAGIRRCPDLSLYHAAMVGPFVEHVLAGDRTPRPWISLIPEPEHAPTSSLSHMVGALAMMLCIGEPAWIMTSRGLAVDLAWSFLQGAELPVVVLATSFALVNLLDARPKLSAHLPEGSRVMLTGGFKGRSRQLSEAELLETVHARLGVGADAVVPEYGMTELTSQAYGRPLHGPPWLKLRVVDPATLSDLPAGEQGLVAVFDLLNLDNVSAILTGDLGTLDAAGGLTLHGRAPGAVLRGCSLTAEELGLEPA